VGEPPEQNEERLAKAVPAIPLYQNSFLFPFKETVRGLVPNGVGSFAWERRELVARG
jgi:hypothetical protein